MARRSFIMKNTLPAVILAGGFGTRLKKVVNDRPKPMALLHEKPFLEYLLEYLQNQFIISEIILSVGYLHEIILSYFGNKFHDIPLSYSIEEEPLGTGGAFKKAINNRKESDFFLINGDTMFQIPLLQLYQKHEDNNAAVSIALKQLTDITRYGTVEIKENKITHFFEKKPVEKGFINGGIYIVNKERFEKLNFPTVFSFENDFLHRYAGKMEITGIPFENFFIDIGIPEDLEKAQTFFK